MKSHRLWMGFTLIELMMVVAILSILLSIGIPKFGNMVNKSREAATRGSLGAIRSAVSIYFSENEGQFPSLGNLDTALTSGGRYLKEIPACQVPPPGNHPKTAGVTDYAGMYLDVGDWMYLALNGTVTVDCTHLDSNGIIWSMN